MSNSIIEAMECDLPVIATDCKYGNREILLNEWNDIETVKKMEITQFGILVPVCDGKKYSFKEKLTNEELEMAKAILYVMKNLDTFKQFSKTRKKDFRLEDRIMEWIEVIEK